MIAFMLFLIIGIKLNILSGWYLFFLILFGLKEATKWSIRFVQVGSNL